MSLGDKLTLLSLLVAVLLIGLIDAKPKSKSYYEILDVEQSAEPKDIKRAYHKLALKFHPDKQPDFDDRKKLEAKFAAITKAYDILSDSIKRQRYDKLLSFGQTEYNEELYRDEDAQRQQETEGGQRTRKSSRQSDAEAGPDQEEDTTRPVKEKFMSDDTVDLIRKISAAVIVIIGGTMLWFLFKASKTYKTITAPTKEQVLLEKKSEIKAAYKEYKDEYERQVELEAQKEEQARKRREIILRKLAERALEEKQSLEQSQHDDVVAEERIRAMMAEMQQVDETKVTRWEGDDDLERLIDEAVQAETRNSNDVDSKKKKKNGTKKPVVATTAPVEEPQKTFSVEEIDDPEEMTSDDGAKVFCSVCKVAFKTDAQLSNHEKSKKHLKNLRDVTRAQTKTKSGGAAPAANADSKGAAKRVRRREEELQIELRESEEIFKPVASEESTAPASAVESDEDSESEDVSTKKQKKNQKNKKGTKNMFDLLGDA